MKEKETKTSNKSAYWYEGGESDEEDEKRSEVNESSKY
jgi:hypothetical protein